MSYYIQRFRKTLTWALVLAVAFPLANGAESLAQNNRSPAGDRRILRFDPLYQSVEPIEQDQLKEGHIYSHFDSQLGRRVWSYWRTDGGFWHALGQGTTQEANQFDPKWTSEEAFEKLQLTDPDLADEIDRSNKPVRLRLNAKDEWERLGTTEVLTIFDAETNYRWEKHSSRYTPVSHLCGYRWTIRDGKYVPLMTGKSHGAIAYLSDGD